MAMSTYGIWILATDQDPRVAELQHAAQHELELIGLHRTVEVQIGVEPPATSGPRVAVFLGSEDASRDDGLARSIQEALDRGMVVIPVVSELALAQAEVAPTLRPINAVECKFEAPPTSLARLLLEELGIEDKQRRVFISHKREDGLGAAEQLYDALSHAGFVPFIDRFAIRAAEEVQAAIADALEDHAFLLLLETPQAHQSDWVFDEVDYALSHTMGTLILTWPANPTPVPGSIGLPRLTLDAHDLQQDSHGFDVFKTSPLDEIVAAIEQAHAQGIVRRRRMIVRSIEEAASAAGCSACIPLRDWRVIVEHANGSELVGTTPRLPVAEDLQALDEARVAVHPDAAAILVHSARTLRAKRREHLSWVAGDRDLELVPENAIGGRWI